MTDYKFATIEAHSLLQINPKNRDEHWENDRCAWLAKWESKLVTEDSRACDCPQGSICEFFDKEHESCLYGEI